MKNEVEVPRRSITATLLWNIHNRLNHLEHDRLEELDREHAGPTISHHALHDEHKRHSNRLLTDMHTMGPKTRENS